MKIDQYTKISQLINANPAVIEAIASINRHFEKLRNPILRKILASRVTIADAAKIGGTTVQQFYEKLGPLGFHTMTAKRVIHYRRLEFLFFTRSYYQKIQRNLMSEMISHKVKIPLKK